MLRSRLRNALLVSVFTLVAAAGSVGAQPGPDDDPDYNDPMWRYADPAAEEPARDAAAESEPVATDSGDASADAALPAYEGQPIDPDDPMWWTAGGR
jgi:hypothetical protein